MIVVDASILATALIDDGSSGDRVRARLRTESLAAPDLLYLEVASVARRALASGRADARRTALALDDLVVFPLLVAPHGPLLPRVWELRENLTPYDAAYVALAESLDCPLLTADLRMSRAAGVRCAFEVLED